MPSRSLDTDALAAFRDVAQGRLDLLETLIDKMRKGNELGVEPGFGLLDGGVAARDAYRTFHQQTWANLQDLRGDLAGIITTLDELAERATEDDEIAEYDLSQGEAS